jgi:hypothetical protein
MWSSLPSFTIELHSFMINSRTNINNLKSFILVTVIIFIYHFSIGQNLIGNFDFENHNQCPPNVAVGGGSYMNFADGWETLYPSSDYFHVCGSNGAAVPNCWYGYQMPYSGQAFAGFMAFQSAYPDSREGIITELLDTMQIGVTYYCSFKINYSGFASSACNRIGMKFSTYPENYPPISPIPYILPNYAHVYTDAVIDETEDWVHVQGSFVADSAYTFVGISNFFDNAHTTTSGSGSGIMYYYIDDVCVSQHPEDCGIVACSPSYNTLSYSTCDSLVSPSGKNTWYTSGIYSDTLKTTLGCDSVLTVNLTIKNSSVTDFKESCESYTWINGVTYYASNNTATYTLTNSAGCDSVITLNLIIGHPSSSTDIIVSCGPYTWIDGVTYSTNTSTATYTTQSSTGCDSLITLNLTIDPIMATIIDNGDGTISAVGGSTYTWMDCSSGLVIPNETNATFAPEQNGLYSAIVSTEDCSDTTTCITIDYLGTSYQESPGFNIFPNPTDGQILMTFNSQEAHLTVMDLKGKEIQSAQVTSGSVISLVDLQSGMYFLMLETATGATVQRIVKR